MLAKTLRHNANWMGNTMGKEFGVEQSKGNVLENRNKK